MPDPNACQSMAQLRAQIDQIDRELVALLAQRMAHIDRAIELKPAEGLPARIDSRVADVLAKIEQQAKQQGLDPALAHALWTDLINWSITREEQVLGKS